MRINILISILGVIFTNLFNNELLNNIINKTRIHKFGIKHLAINNIPVY
jgi:hypothetical protein